MQAETKANHDKAELGAKLLLAKTACKRLRADLQAQVDRTATVASDLAASQVPVPLSPCSLLAAKVCCEMLHCM